jgi:hypothetical protein
MNCEIMRMDFIDIGGQHVILGGMSSGAPRIISRKSMEDIFRHGDVMCVA